MSLCSNCGDPHALYVCGQKVCLQQGTIYCEKCRNRLLTYVPSDRDPQYICAKHRKDQTNSYANQQKCPCCFKKYPRNKCFNCIKCVISPRYCKTCKTLQLACVTTKRGECYTCPLHVRKRQRTIFKSVWRQKQGALLDSFLHPDINHMVRKYVYGF